jgi:hypothetical protein
VFFNELGGAWPEHRCLGYLTAQYGKEFVERGMALQMMLPGSRVGSSINRTYAAEAIEAAQAQRSHRIVRQEAVQSEISDLGVIREILASVNVYAKLGLEQSPLARGFVKLIGDGPFAQVTVHVGDIADEDVKSYTFFVEQNLLNASGLQKGQMAVFCVNGVQLGTKSVWVATLLQSPM